MSTDPIEVVRFNKVQLKFPSSIGTWGIVQSALGIEDREVLKSEGSLVGTAVSDFVVHQGDVLGVVAINGSGKSSLLRLISGLYSPNAGTVQVFGKDPCDGSLRGRVFKTNPGGALFTDFSALDNIKKVASLYFFNLEDIDSLARKVLAFLGFLDQDLDKPSQALSTGNKVKVTIATSIVCLLASNDGDEKPKLIILDEPTATLDPVSIPSMHEVIRCLKQNMPDLTIILATNSANDLAVCNKLVVINDGYLIDCSKDLRGIKKGISRFNRRAVRPIQKRIKSAGSGNSTREPFPTDVKVRRVRPNPFRVGSNPFLWRMAREFSLNKFLLFTLLVQTILPNLMPLFALGPSWTTLAKTAVGVFLTMIIREGYRNLLRERVYYKGFEEFILSPITRNQHLIYAGISSLLFNLVCTILVIPFLYLLCLQDLVWPLAGGINRESLLMVSIMFVMCVFFAISYGILHSTLPFIVKESNHFFFQWIIPMAVMIFSGFYFSLTKMPTLCRWVAMCSPLTYLGQAMDEMGAAPDWTLMYWCAGLTVTWVIGGLFIYHASYNLARHAKRIREA